MISIPSTVVNHYLIKKAEEAYIFKFMDYLLIINNLNPLTMSYEDTKQSKSKYIWVYHNSYGEILENFFL